MKGWLVASLLAVALLAQCAVERTRDGALRAIHAEQQRVAKHTADSLKNLNAQQEIRAEAEADSLRRLVARAKSSTRLIVRHDTALVPLTEYVYIRDTVLTQCAACANRLDSLVAQHRAERDANERFTSFLQRDLKALERTATRARLTSRFGVFLGYATQRQADGILRTGPVLGVGVRILP